jgi:hypothetical protein
MAALAVNSPESSPNTNEGVEPQEGASGACLSNSEDLRVMPLGSEAEGELFCRIYNDHVKPFYPECDDYATCVLRVYRQGWDDKGYFTRQKLIWTLKVGATAVGFSVVTAKRGGSFKFGPTAILPGHRGRHLGVKFRHLIEAQYPSARKFYATIPDDNIPALRYLIAAGYTIEAHLQAQYRRTQGEIVFGKLLDSSYPPEIPAQSAPTGDLKIVDGAKLPGQTLSAIVRSLLASSYDEIDEGYIQGLINTISIPINLGEKAKRVAVAFRRELPVGFGIFTPKRGGSLKASPFALCGPDAVGFAALVHWGVNSFPGRTHQKVYMHLPCVVPYLINHAKRLGFGVEGILREPYKPGIDLMVLARQAGLPEA